MADEGLLRRLGLKESVSLVIGTVIGTGVFLKAAAMSQSTGSPFWVLMAWVVGGVLSLAGALCYSELGALYPQAGGEYVFLREGYGDLMAFLYGWMRFWIGTPGSIAAYSVGAATFLEPVLFTAPASAPPRQLVALVFIAILSAVNCFSVVFGGRVQNFLTALKLFMILGLTYGIFLFAKNGNWSHFQSVDAGTGFIGTWRGWSAFGSAVLAALWAYDGWNNLPMAAGEIRDPGRNVPRALGFGMLAILLIYVGANLSYFYAMPFSDVLSSYSSLQTSALPVASKAALMAFGPWAVGLLSFGFVISAIGSINGSVLTGARVPYAMARDGLFFRQFGNLSRVHRVPIFAVVVQALIASLLALSGTFDQLTDYVIFASWIFYALVTASLYISRRKEPTRSRPFRTPGYPIMPAVFIFVSILLLINTLWTAPRESGTGLVFILIGVPVYYFFKRNKKLT